MRRKLLSCWALIVVACAIAPVTLAGEPAKECNIIALAHDSTRAGNIGPVQLDEPATAVIRSAEELVARSSQAGSAKDVAVQNELEAELAKVLGVESIDWSKQMALVVRGEPGTKADKVRFGSLTFENNVLTVVWRVIPRPPHAGPGTPIALILVDRFDGEVKFVPAEPK